MSYATAYNYDRLNRPVNVSWSPAPAFAAAAASSVTFTHAYNGANQRISQTVSDNSWWYYPPASASPVNYASNAANQYTAVGAVTPGYNANGNLTNDGTFTFGYDAENRLTSAVGAGNTASYAFDSQGRICARLACRENNAAIFRSDPRSFGGLSWSSPPNNGSPRCSAGTYRRRHASGQTAETPAAGSVCRI